MKRTLGFIFLVVILSLGAACASEKTANDNSGPKTGAVETNANVQNLNANNVPANVGVVTNNNGNKNTAGVRPINGNANNNQK